VRTFRSAVSGRPEGLHYIGVKNAIAGLREIRLKADATYVRKPHTHVREKVL